MICYWIIFMSCLLGGLRGVAGGVAAAFSPWLRAKWKRKWEETMEMDYKIYSALWGRKKKRNSTFTHILRTTYALSPLWNSDCGSIKPLVTDPSVKPSLSNSGHSKLFRNIGHNRSILRKRRNKIWCHKCVKFQPSGFSLYLKEAQLLNFHVLQNQQSQQTPNMPFKGS